MSRPRNQAFRGKGEYVATNMLAYWEERLVEILERKAHIEAQIKKEREKVG